MIDCALLKNSSLIRIKTRGIEGNTRRVPVTREADGKRRRLLAAMSDAAAVTAPKRAFNFGGGR